MRSVVLTLIVVVTCSAPCAAQDEGFELCLSGKLAELLPDDTSLVFWHPSTKIDGATVAIANFPAHLPANQFTDKAWHVNFVSANQGPLFSMTLSADLFDKPRTIDLKLDRPSPHIIPTFFFGKNAKYFAGITKRMRYRDLPRWDHANDRFGRPATPKMIVTRLADGKLIHNAPMEDGCMASRWWAFLDKNIKLKDGVTYRFAVVYDSGGLFPVFETSKDFTYWSHLHGE